MIVFLMLYLALFITIAIFYFQFRSFTKPRNNILLGVTLTSDAFEDDKIKELVANFNKASKRNSIIYFILSSLMIVTTFSPYFSILFTYWVICFLVILIHPYTLFYRYNTKLSKLKYKLGYVSENKNTVFIDTRLTQALQKKSFNNYLFVLPLLASLLIAFFFYTVSPILIATLILSNLLFILINKAFQKMRPKVYSDDTLLNIKINHYVRHQWSLFWLYTMILFTFNVLFFLYFIPRPTATVGIGLIGILFTALELLLVAYTVSSIHKMEKGAQPNHYISDQDTYWIGGILYCNPNDNALLVPSRAQWGTTFNVAKLSGKLLLGGALLLLVASLGYGLFYSIAEDVVTPTISYEDSTIHITSAVYSDTFTLEDIIDIQLLDTYPNGMKTKGSSTELYARGEFYLSHYGNATMYVFKTTPQYILIQLPTKSILYNEKTIEDTIAIYNLLEGLIN